MSRRGGVFFEFVFLLCVCVCVCFYEVRRRPLFLGG